MTDIQRIKEYKGSIITAAVCLITAFIMLVRFFAFDSSYSFDLSFVEENPDSLVINCFNLRRGSFDLMMDYDTDNDTAAHIQADNDKAFDIPLPAGGNPASMPFSLTHPTDRFKITIPLQEGQSFSLKEVRLTSGRIPIFTDSLLYGMLFFLAGIIILLHRKKLAAMDGEDRKAVIILLLLIVAVNIPYYQKALGFTADIRAHMQRIEGIMRGLMDHQFPVIVSPNFMNEFGEISFMYPDLFLYPFGILRILGVSMLTAYRLCMLAVNAATAVIAYLSFRLMCRNRNIIYLAVFLITFEPYRLYNILGRGSGAGNAIASAFLPLVAAGVYLILKGDKRWWILSLGLTGVIESHILTLVLLVITLLIMGIVFIKELLKDKKYMLLLKAAGLTLIMNAGFLIIFLKCYMTDWSSAALEWSDFAESSFRLSEALSNEWSLFEAAAFAVGIILLLAIKEKKSIEYKLSLAMIILGGVIFVTTFRVFPWRSLTALSPALDRFTTMLQVPQRVYAVSSVLFICGIALLADMRYGKESAGKIRLIGPEGAAAFVLGAVILFGTVCAFADYYSAAPLMPDEVYGDHNSLPIKDYIPTGASDETWSLDAGYVSDESAVESLAYNKNGTHIDYTYISGADGSYAVMPLLYYEWYRAKDEAGNRMQVRKSDDGRVTVDLTGDGMQHEAHIWFDMGMGYSILYVCSLLFMIGFILMVWKKRMWKEILQI